MFQGVLRVADSVLATIYHMTLYTICHASEREDKSHPTHINPSFSWEGVIVPHPPRGGLTRDSGQISVTSRCISAFCESFERVSIQRYVLHDSKMMKLYIYKVVLGRNSWGLEVSSEILCSRSREEGRRSKFFHRPHPLYVYPRNFRRDPAGDHGLEWHIPSSLVAEVA